MVAEAEVSLESLMFSLPLIHRKDFLHQEQFVKAAQDYQETFQKLQKLRSDVPKRKKISTEKKEQHEQAKVKAKEEVEAAKTSFKEAASQFVVKNFLSDLQNYHLTNQRKLSDYNAKLMVIINASKEKLKKNHKQFYPLVEKQFDAISQALDDVAKACEQPSNLEEQAKTVFQALLQYILLCQQVNSNYLFYSKLNAIAAEKEAEFGAAANEMRRSLFEVIKCSQIQQRLAEESLGKNKERSNVRFIVDWIDALEHYDFSSLTFHKGKIEIEANENNQQGAIDERAQNYHRSAINFALHFAKQIGQIRVAKDKSAAKPAELPTIVEKPSASTNWNDFFSGIIEGVVDGFKNTSYETSRWVNEYLTRFTYQAPVAKKATETERQQIANKHQKALGKMLVAQANLTINKVGEKFAKLNHDFILSFLSDEQRITLNAIGQAIQAMVNDVNYLDAINPELFRQLAKAHDQAGFFDVFVGIRKSSITAMERVAKQLFMYIDNVPTALESLVGVFQYLPNTSKCLVPLAVNLYRRFDKLTLDKKIDLLNAFIVRDSRDQKIRVGMKPLFEKIRRELLDNLNDLPLETLKRFLRIVKQRNNDINERQEGFLGLFRKAELKQLFVLPKDEYDKIYGRIQQLENNDFPLEDLPESLQAKGLQATVVEQALESALVMPDKITAALEMVNNQYQEAYGEALTIKEVSQLRILLQNKLTKAEHKQKILEATKYTESRIFYVELQKSLNSLFVTAQAIQTGRIKTIHLGATGYLSDGLSIAGRIIPGLGMLSTAMDWVDQQKEEVEAKKIAGLTITDKATRQLIESLTLAITECLNQHPEYRLSEIDNIAVLVNYVKEKLIVILLNRSHTVAQKDQIENNYADFIRSCVDDLTRYINPFKDSPNRWIKKVVDQSELTLRDGRRVNAETYLHMSNLSGYVVTSAPLPKILSVATPLVQANDQAIKNLQQEIIQVQQQLHALQTGASSPRGSGDIRGGVDDSVVQQLETIAQEVEVLKRSVHVEIHEEPAEQQLLMQKAQLEALSQKFTAFISAQAKANTQVAKAIYTFEMLSQIAIPNRKLEVEETTKTNLYPTGLESASKGVRLPAKGKAKYKRSHVIEKKGTSYKVLLLDTKDDGIMPGVIGVIMNTKFYQALAEIIHIQIQNGKNEFIKRMVKDLKNPIRPKDTSDKQKFWDAWQKAVVSNFDNNKANRDLVTLFLENTDCKKSLLNEIETAIKSNDTRLKKQLYKGTYQTSVEQKNQLQGNLSGIEQTQRIRKYKARFGNGIGAFIAKLWHEFGGKDRKQVNFGMAMEGLANALFRFYNHTQRQDLVPMSDAEKRTNFVLAGNWNNNFTGLTKHLVSDGMRGHLIALDTKGDPHRTEEGYYLADNTIQDLGRALPFMLLCEDDDGIGSRAQNKGYIPVTQSDGSVINKFFVIDCGHAFSGEAQLIKQLSNDFSISQGALNKFKNFSILFDADITEAMESIHILRKLRTGKEPSAAVLQSYPKLQEKLANIQQNQDTTMFEAYAEYLGNTDGAEEQKYYQANFRVAKKNYKAAAAKMLAIFADRLNLTAPELKLLDNLEKLTSKTTNIAQVRKKTIVLNHLKKTHRVAWQAKKEGNWITFSTDQDRGAFNKILGFLNAHANKVTNHQEFCQKILKRFKLAQQFLSQGQAEFITEKFKATQTTIGMSFSILVDAANAAECVATFSEVFSEENIAAFKDQPIASKWHSARVAAEQALAVAHHLSPIKMPMLSSALSASIERAANVAEENQRDGELAQTVVEEEIHSHEESKQEIEDGTAIGMGDDVQEEVEGVSLLRPSPLFNLLEQPRSSLRV